MNSVEAKQCKRMTCYQRKLRPLQYIGLTIIISDDWLLQNLCTIFVETKPICDSDHELSPSYLVIYYVPTIFD